MITAEMWPTQHSNGFHLKRKRQHINEPITARLEKVHKLSIFDDRKKKGMEGKTGNILNIISFTNFNFFRFLPPIYLLNLQEKKCTTYWFNTKKILLKSKLKTITVNITKQSYRNKKVT